MGKNSMTQMEDVTMTLTGCSRQVANTVVNTIIDETEKHAINEVVDKCLGER